MVNSWNVCLPMGNTIKIITQRAFYPIKQKMNCLSLIYFFREQIFATFYSLYYEALFVRELPSSIFLLAFCWLNQWSIVATINIKVEAGFISFTHLISKVGPDYAVQETLYQWVLLLSVKLTKTCDSMFLQCRSGQFLLKPRLFLNRLELCPSANLC